MSNRRLESTVANHCPSSLKAVSTTWEWQACACKRVSPFDATWSSSVFQTRDMLWKFLRIIIFIELDDRLPLVSGDLPLALLWPLTCTAPCMSPFVWGVVNLDESGGSISRPYLLGECWIGFAWCLNTVNNWSVSRSIRTTKEDETVPKTKRDESVEKLRQVAPWIPFNWGVSLKRDVKSFCRLGRISPISCKQRFNIMLKSVRKTTDCLFQLE